MASLLGKRAWHLGILDSLLNKQLFCPKLPEYLCFGFYAWFWPLGQVRKSKKKKSLWLKIFIQKWCLIQLTSEFTSKGDSRVFGFVTLIWPLRLVWGRRVMWGSLIWGVLGEVWKWAQPVQLNRTQALVLVDLWGRAWEWSGFTYPEKVHLNFIC